MTRENQINCSIHNTNYANLTIKAPFCDSFKQCNQASSQAVKQKGKTIRQSRTRTNKGGHRGQIDRPAVMRLLFSHKFFGNFWRAEWDMQKI